MNVFVDCACVPSQIVLLLRRYANQRGILDEQSTIIAFVDIQEVTTYPQWNYHKKETNIFYAAGLSKPHMH